MKKIFRPIVKAFQNYYEGTTLTKAPRSMSRKVRKYANIDISKDFERRTDKYEHKKKQVLEELYNTHGDNLIGDDGLIRQDMINSFTNELMEIKGSDDITTKYLVTGIRKMCILGVIKYRQTNHHLFDDSKLHPETQKRLEELHYLTEHNLPIEKSLLFEMVPELFRYEIGKLPAEERKLYKLEKKAFLRADGISVEMDAEDNQLMFEDEDTLKLSKIMNMEHYILDQSREVLAIYRDRIEEYLKENEYRSFWDYLQQLDVMDPENMLPWERSLMEEVYELRAIEQDTIALKEKYIKQQSEAITYPMYLENNEKLIKKWIADTKYIYKYKTVDIRDTTLIPPPPNRGPSFDERLRIATGGKIDEYLDQERAQFIEDANAR